MEDYEKYEVACKKIRHTNEGLINDFAERMKAEGLSKSTIDKHVYNVAFYINEFLLYEDAVEAREGIHSISMFLGYWFIRKAMWASQASVKSNAASIKKFYALLVEKGLVDEADYVILRETIKEEMPDWLEAVR